MDTYLGPGVKLQGLNCAAQRSSLRPSHAFLRATEMEVDANPKKFLACDTSLHHVLFKMLASKRANRSGLSTCFPLFSFVFGG